MPVPCQLAVDQYGTNSVKSIHNEAIAAYSYNGLWSKTDLLGDAMFSSAVVRFRGIVCFLLILISMSCLTLRADAQERLALLIGNQGYKDSIGPLRNPHADVTLIAASLEKLGFKVTVMRDAGYKAIDTALKTHIQQVRRAGKDAISFFYYSGHGASDPETHINYLIPTDVERADDADLWTNSIELNDIVTKLRDQAGEATHYVVFDACREELRLTRQGKKALGAEKGFTPVSTVSGVMIAYATAPGRTASDVGKTAGPYAAALAEEIGKPGVEAVTMFRNVQLRVKQAIGQDPWLSFPTLPAVFLAGAKTAQDMELEAWSEVKDEQDPRRVADFLSHFPDGIFAPLAKALIAQFEQQAKVAAARQIEEQRRQDEALKRAEARRLADEQRAREAVLEGRRREAESKDNAQRTEELRRQLEAEALEFSEKMKKALEEVRVAREQAALAEKERLLALQAAEAAQHAVAETKAQQPAKADRIVLAELPKPEAPTAQNFDGTWTFRNSSQTCPCAA